MSGTPETVVIDEGSAQAKATFKQGDDIVTVTIASRLEADAKVKIEGYSPSSYFTAEGDSYTVNADLDDTVDTYVPSYQTSSANRAIIHEALRVAGFSGKNVRICVTLPLARYFGNGDTPKDEVLIERKRENSMAGIKAANGAKLAKIVECRVYPEALPALFEITREDDGSLKSGFNDTDKSLVVDIGGATTDITVITPAGDIQGFDSIQDCGVLDIADRLSKALIQRFDLKTQRLPSSVLDQVLRESKFAGEDVSKEVQKASRKTLQTIANRLEKMVHTPTLLDNVLIVGGGAFLLGKQLADTLGVDAIIPKNADEVISRGIYKLEMLTHASSDQNDD